MKSKPSRHQGPPRPPAARPDELRFTQNFLHSPALVERIVTLAQLSPGSPVLEIGPGKGIITRRLAAVLGRDGQVIAVELDKRLADTLRQQLADLPQVRVINADMLQFPLSDLPAGYAVFANVPFNITSPLLEHLFQPLTGPAQAHLILQTDALTGTLENGAPAETFKSLMLKPFYQLAVAHRFASSDFAPQPAVDTALFAFSRRAVPLLDPAQYPLYKDFLAFVSKDRAGEGNWRKVFSKLQLQKLVEQHGLIDGRGLKSQSVEALTGAFAVFSRGDRARHGLVTGAMAALREEQQRREQINRAGGHRRQPGR